MINYCEPTVTVSFSSLGRFIIFKYFKYNNSDIFEVRIRINNDQIDEGLTILRENIPSEKWTSALKDFMRLSKKLNPAEVYKDIFELYTKIYIRLTDEEKLLLEVL